MKEVVIVGGGTGGWLSALHIKTALGGHANVTLIESEDIPTIGVGEGTIPLLRQHFLSARIDEDECVRHCGATYKNGIRFVGWCGGDGPGEYFHPFFSGKPNDITNPVWSPHLWLRQFLHNTPNLPSLAKASWPETTLIEQKKAPIAFQNGKRIESPIVNYALHIDAAKLGLFLRDIAKKRGVRHVTDTVLGLNRADAGTITSVKTANHGHVGGQFFVDCTGFHRLLIGQMTDDFVDYRQCLLNDRAVTARIPNPHGRPTGIESATTSTARKYGWIWQVPLYDRLGVGYVYSSQFVSDEEAERELVEFLGADPPQTTRIKFRTGHYRQAWVKNCVAIGLSGGFIEPLEATGIGLISYSLFRLLELWPSATFPACFRDRFNDLMNNSYQWIRDFIVMHYCLSQRDDTPYWLAVRSEEAVPDSVRETLEFYDHAWPFGDVADSKNGFRLPFASTACVLAGFNRFPRQYNSYVAGLMNQQVEQTLSRISARNQAVAQACPDHGEFLMQLNT